MAERTTKDRTLREREYSRRKIYHRGFNDLFSTEEIDVQYVNAHGLWEME